MKNIKRDVSGLFRQMFIFHYIPEAGISSLHSEQLSQLLTCVAELDQPISHLILRFQFWSLKIESCVSCCYVGNLL
jgi:hypothetical protein